MLATVGTISLTAVTIVGYGTCFGIGFWVSKKVTNKIDEVLLKYDAKELKRIYQETQQEVYG